MTRKQTGPAEDPLGQIFEQVMRQLLVATSLIAVVALAAGFAFDSWAGAWGALIGVLVALLFSGTTVVSMRFARHRSPSVLAGVVLGSWIAKMVLLIALLAVLQDLTFYNKGVLAAVLVATVLVSVAIDVRAVLRARIPHGETPDRFPPEGHR